MSRWNDGAYTAGLTAEVTRLLGAYFVAPAPEKVAVFVGALRYKGVSVERTTRAVDELIASHAKCPAPAQLVSAALGAAGRSAAESEARARDQALMRDHLERLCDFDVWDFQRAYGVFPDRALYQRIGLTPPASMTFRVPPREQCAAQREAAKDACRAAFDRMRTTARAPLRAPEPVAPAQTVPAQLALDADAAHDNEAEPITDDQAEALADLGWIDELAEREEAA